MGETWTAFQIDRNDNVATALTELPLAARVAILGDAATPALTVVETIPCGHKLALYNIENGTDIIKYGVVIGRAMKSIPQGAWVHLHTMRSVYDDRSSHLDVRTGAPKDTHYD